MYVKKKSVSNESRCSLYIDVFMTVRYSHEAWEGHVCSANSHEAWKGRVCPWRTDTVASVGEDALVQRFQEVMFGGNF